MKYNRYALLEDPLLHATLGYVEAAGRLVAALQEEFEKHIDGSYGLLLDERKRHATNQQELFEEYDKKLDEMKKYIVGKVEEFLNERQEVTEVVERAAAEWAAQKNDKADSAST